MVEKKLTLTIRARNALQAGLAKSRASLSKFAAGATRFGKALAKGFLIAGAALVAFGTKAVSMFAEQEKSEKAVIASLNAHGEAGEKLLPKLKAIAGAIQDQTGAADENTLQGMANMRMLGVQTEQLGRASKGVIALTRAGLGNEAAQKAMAMAIQGNFDMLNRYLPALKGTTDASEKAIIVNDFLIKGYAAQQEELNTVTGRWKALKGRVGDAWEEVGKAVAMNGQVTATLDKMGEAVKAFGNKVAAWVAAGGFQKFHASAVFVLDDTVDRVRFFVATVAAKWRNMTNKIGNSMAKLWARLTGKEWVVAREAAEEIPKRGSAAYDKYQKRLAEIDDKILKGTEDTNAKRVESAEGAAADIINAEEQAAAGRVKLQKDQARLIKEEANAAKKAAQEKIKGIEAEIRKREELAKKTVKAFMDEKKAEQDHKKALEADANKADKLRAKQARGIKLSKKDRAFLEAFGEIEAAQQAIKPGQPGNLANQLAKAKAQFEELKGQGRTLNAIRKELAANNKALNTLLRFQ